MKYEQLSKTKVVETPDGQHLPVISYEKKHAEQLEVEKGEAEVTVQLPDGTTLIYRVFELRPGNANILADQAMATFFPTPKD